MINALINLLLIACFPLFYSTAQGLKSDAAQEGLRGKVKSIRYETAKLNNKSGLWTEGKRKLHRVIAYDETGNKLKETFLADTKGVADFDRRANTLITYRYDAKGNRSETVVLRYLGENDGQLSRRVFKHDGAGNRVEEAVFGKEITYTEDILITGPVRALGGESLLGVYVHTYDAAGNRTITEWKENGIVYDRWVYTIDKEGVVSEMAHYRRGHLKIREAYEYEFDSAGNWQKRTRSKWISKDGKSRFEPQEVDYRHITYY